MDPATLAMIGMAVASAAGAGATLMGADATNRANANINKSTMEMNWASQQEGHNRAVDMMRETSDRNRQDAATAWDRTLSFQMGQRDWTQQMANTSYQRAMADMRAAGLNPLLAYQQGGAVTPGAASVSAQPASSSGSAGGALGAPSQIRMENALGPAVSSAMQGARTIADLRQAGAAVDNTTAQTALATADADRSRSQTALNSASTIREAAQARLIDRQAATAAMEPALRIAQTSAASAQAALAAEQRASEAERQPLLRAQTGEAIQRSNLTRTEDVQRNTYGPPGPVSSTVGGVSQILDSIRRSLW